MLPARCWLLGALLWLLAVPCLVAEDAPPVFQELDFPVEELEDLPIELRQDLERALRAMRAGQQAVGRRGPALDAAGRFVPGRALALQAPAPQALRIEWAEYITIIAIQHGAGDDRWRRAWVATFDRAGAMVVAYTGAAFIAGDGDLHIDCQRVHISGPMAQQWSPDSFAVQADGQVRIIDDNDNGSISRHLRRESPGDIPRDPYRAHLTLARAMVEGML